VPRLAWVLIWTALVAPMKVHCQDPSAATETPARLLWKSAPKYPYEMRELRKAGSVRVRVLITKEGLIRDPVIESSSDPEFTKEVMHWLSQQKAVPALKAGQPVEHYLEEIFYFDPEGRGFHAASFVKAGQPMYPMSLESSRLTGDVTARYVVTKDGSIKTPVVTASSHPAFEHATVIWLLQQKAIPGLEDGDDPVEMEFSQTFHFSPTSGKLLALPEPAEFKLEPYAPATPLPAGWPRLEAYDIAPEVKYRAPAVYPLRMLRSGKDGSAKVSILIGPEGIAHELKVLEASDPDFGAATMASLEASTFEPARKGNSPVWSLVTRTQQFRVEAADVQEDDSTIRLLDQLIEDSPRILTASDLDAKPAAIYRPEPVYPRSFRESSLNGRVTIEFFIDRTGAVKLPTFIDADQPEFGWAAVTGAERWRYGPPLRNGQAVDVRVRAALDFKIDKASGRRR
jgi:TonB family protein